MRHHAIQECLVHKGARQSEKKLRGSVLTNFNYAIMGHNNNIISRKACLDV